MAHKGKVFAGMIAAALLAVGGLIVSGSASPNDAGDFPVPSSGKADAKIPFGVAFPGPDPGPAQAVITSGSLRLSNKVLAAEWSVEGPLRLVKFVDALSGTRVVGLGDELFAIEAPPLGLTSADFEVDGTPHIEELLAEPKAARVSQRLPGRALVVRLKHAGSGMVVEWRAELRQNSHYVRQVLNLGGPAGMPAIRSLDPLIVKAAGAAVVGSVPGSPVVAGQAFLGVELPMADARVVGNAVRWRIEGGLRSSEERPYRVGSVIGIIPAGQTRRAFAAYLERERARESRPFLHYNGWYDLGEGVNDRDMRKVVAIFDRELIRKRSIPLESFVLDDGWDDPTSGFWTVNRTKFPDGFRPLVAEIKRAGSHLGIWISPLAGYNGQEERVKRAREAGIVPPRSGLSLDLPSYAGWWLERCSAFIRDDGVNYFKWDNAADFTALARIAEDLRTIDPNLFINTTVNTFPSPFFLNTMDATWRGGDDCGWFGPGPSREQYITYRDKELYARVVRRAPLYPINSIMHCAPVLGRFYQAAKIAGDMKNDVRALFGMGPVLQELYIGPDLMTERWWDELAEAIRWEHANADVLTDAHWIGGDPEKLEVYGCAAWAPRKGTIMLRNPADKRAAVTLDAEKVFELPEGAARAYDLTAAYPDQRVGRLRFAAGSPLTLDLEPFEVLVFNALPERLLKNQTRRVLR